MGLGLLHSYFIWLKSMKITKISQQIKRPERYSVYIDEKYTFSLHEQQLAESGLTTGKELTQKEVNSFKNESEFGKAYERSLNYALLRPRSLFEIKNYLTRTFMYPKPKVYTNKAGERIIKKVEVDKAQIEDMIERIIERLTERKYVNDETFAKAWVESRRYFKKTSTRRLQQELRAKGVRDTIIATVLQNEESTDLQMLQQVIQKKRRISRYSDNEKLTTYLLRQGFSYADILVTLKNIDSQEIEDVGY